ncbi:hypothetical protein [Tenacibaculum sp. SDUM215027]|uniref:hypothetical protein n=1 Tax=Tenacibaculum sp. SDUM215027 TaxID=3422596 RepID=UPI003D31FAD5
MESLIAKAVQALSKDENLQSKKERMIDSLNRINELQKEVGIIKIADRITNLQRPHRHWDKKKIITYYEEAKFISSILSNKNDYLNQRLKSKILDYKKMIDDLI